MLSSLPRVGLALRANLGVRQWANSGRGKASPCTPDQEGAAKPRPYLMPFKSVICTPYSEIYIHLRTFAQAAGRFALLHYLSPGPRFPFSVAPHASLSLPVPHPPDQLTEPAGGLGGSATAFAEEDEDFLAAE